MLAPSSAINKFVHPKIFKMLLVFKDRMYRGHTTVIFSEMHEIAVIGWKEEDRKVSRYFRRILLTDDDP
jgi:hypothetical protein